MDEIFQRKPLRSKPSIFRVKSWTHSIESYCEEAKQLTQCILHNRRLMRRPYRWFLTINFEHVMEPSLIKSRWKSACDNGFPDGDSRKDSIMGRNNETR
jgi:hypothetical protein